MALREVNLVPDDYLFKRNLSRHLSLWLGLLILSLASISGFHLYQTTRAHSGKAPLESMKTAEEQLSLKIEEINRLRDELIRLDQQKSGLEKAIRNPFYSRVLINLVGIMSNRTWITQLNIENDKEAVNESQMSLKGYTEDSADLGNFLKNLTENTLFHYVSLIYAREAILTETEHQANKPSGLIEFQIECRVAG